MPAKKKKEAKKESPEKIVQGAFMDEEMSSEEQFYHSEENRLTDENRGLYNGSSGGKTYHCQYLFFPGDEPVLETIMNNKDNEVINKIVTTTKEGNVACFVEYIQIS